MSILKVLTLLTKKLIGEDLFKTFKTFLHILRYTFDFCANTLGEGMNQTVLFPAMSK